MSKLINKLKNNKAFLYFITNIKLILFIMKLCMTSTSTSWMGNKAAKSKMPVLQFKLQSATADGTAFCIHVLFTIAGI